MEEGDIIYVKQGPRIVGKGAVSGPYQFDKKNRIVDPYGVPWQHQRRVSWASEFPEVEIQLGRQQMMTLVPLNGQDVKRVEQAVKACLADQSAEEKVLREGKVVSMEPLKGSSRTRR